MILQMSFFYPNPKFVMRSTTVYTLTCCLQVFGYMVQQVVETTCDNRVVIKKLLEIVQAYPDIAVIICCNLYVFWL